MELTPLVNVKTPRSIKQVEFESLYSCIKSNIGVNYEESPKVLMMSPHNPKSKDGYTYIEKKPRKE